MKATELNLDDRLTQTLATIFGVEPEVLGDEASPATVANWDSLNHLNMLMALESEFAVRLSADDALEMRDVAAIRRILRSRGAVLE
jgi:acyl carrier protein